jgi:hypothetical protein
MRPESKFILVVQLFVIHAFIFVRIDSAEMESTPVILIFDPKWEKIA